MRYVYVNKTNKAFLSIFRNMMYKNQSNYSFKIQKIVE